MYNLLKIADLGIENVERMEIEDDAHESEDISLSTSE